MSANMLMSPWYTGSLCLLTPKSARYVAGLWPNILFEIYIHIGPKLLVMFYSISTELLECIKCLSSLTVNEQMQTGLTEVD